MKNILKISQKLKTINKKVYIVWGFCRERIMGLGNEWGDIDLVTDAKPEEMKTVLNVVGEVGKKYGTCIVREGSDTFEMTTFREDIWSINNRRPAEVIFTDSLEKDAQRRDFTCNCVYYDVVNDVFIDPVWGINDIKNNIIRFVWDIEERIEEDALRILRFIRFKNKYWFSMSTEGFNPLEVLEYVEWEYTTLKILKEKSYLLKNISVERIRQELDKILLLVEPKTSPFFKGSTWNVMEGEGFWNIQALQNLKDIDFFKHIIPEIDTLKNVPWNKYHLEWNVWIHTKMCIEALNNYYISWSTEGFNPLNNNEKLIFYYSLLFHDIAKYDTLSFDENKEAHYFNHENIWAEIFKSKIANRLKFTNKQKKEITWLIKNHIRLFSLPKMKRLKARKFMMESLFEKLLIIWEADSFWKIPINEEKILEIKNIYSDFKLILEKKVFLTWKDIIENYPELEWNKIWNKLAVLNDEILLND